MDRIVIESELLDSIAIERSPAALDGAAVKELIEKLQQQLPDHEIVYVQRWMVGGLTGAPPFEQLVMMIHVQIPWNDLAGPAAAAFFAVLREVIVHQLQRQRSMPVAGDNIQAMQDSMVEEAVAKISLYGPDGKVLSQVNQR